MTLASQGALAHEAEPTSAGSWSLHIHAAADAADGPAASASSLPASSSGAGTEYRIMVSAVVSFCLSRLLVYRAAQHQSFRRPLVRPGKLRHGRSRPSRACISYGPSVLRRAARVMPPTVPC